MKTTIYMYLDGERTIDVTNFARTHHLSLEESKKYLEREYSANAHIEFYFCNTGGQDADKRTQKFLW
jgi:hypothetical protein